MKRATRRCVKENKRLIQAMLDESTSIDDAARAVSDRPDCFAYWQNRILRLIDSGELRA